MSDLEISNNSGTDRMNYLAITQPHKFTLIRYQYEEKKSEKSAAPAQEAQASQTNTHHFEVSIVTYHKIVIMM